MTDHPAPGSTASPPEEPRPGTTGRRRFLGYLLAAPTVVAAARLGAELVDPPAADAAMPGTPEPADLYDLSDALTDAARPTANLITVEMRPDGTAAFALHRTEVGQGITTAVAMLIAEELSLPVSKVRVTLADARPELVFNQITGGSNSMHAITTPVRVAAAIARQQLLTTAAAQWRVPVSQLSTKDGVISHGGQRIGYGELAKAAASTRNRQVSVLLKPSTQFTVIGKPQNRIDALEAVTGRKTFAMDLQIPNAKPTMVCRPPTLKGTVRKVNNLAEVKAMPGITDVATISSGVAVRGDTFGQCIDAVRALKVTWGPGPIDGESDDTVLRKLKAATLPMTTPATPLTGVVDAEFTFSFASNTPLETNCAVADVRKDRAEIWSSLKIPIVAQSEIAQKLGLPQNKVAVHVAQGGGSFGRHLFHDAAMDAAEASKAFGKPVKLMWHRTDDFRHGRAHPMSFSRIRATYAAGNVLSFEQHHTSVKTDFGHGVGEVITSTLAKQKLGNYSVAQGIFVLSQSTPYNLGVTTQLLNEVELDFATGSMRNVYSPNVCCAQELVVDELAAKLGQDRYAFRHALAKNARTKAVLERLAKEGQWGRALPSGMAQGIAVHNEYKAVSAALVEIDCRPETVNRKPPVEEGVTGPRVTKVTFVVDPGMCINPRGMEAQMLGGINDGVGLALTFSTHIDHGLPLEGSWNNSFYTRQWNTPLQIKVVILPNSNDDPCGAGELAVSASMAATACAYAKAVNKVPDTFPINHGTLGFQPLPRIPSIPQSPTDGLDHTY